MGEKVRKTGIPHIGDVPWGTHFCLLYRTKEDLTDILVPYFKAGLDNNEFCMWVTSESLGVEGAKASLKKVVEDLDSHIANGQIEILDCSQWYTKTGTFEGDKGLKGWVEKETQAVQRGFDRIRLAVNTSWLKKRDSTELTDYEAAVGDVIAKYGGMGVCCYSLDECGASKVIDLISHHQFALARREGKWRVIESSGRKRVEQAYRAAVQSSLQGLVIIQDFRIVFADPAFARISGYTIEELMSLSPEEVKAMVHPDDQALVWGRFRDRLGGKRVPRYYEYRGIRKDGAERWLEMFASRIEYHGRPAVQAAIVDITERKRAEHEISLRTKQLSSINEVGQRVAPISGLSELYQTMVEAVQEKFGYQLVTIFSVQEDKVVLEAVADAQLELIPPGYSQKIGEGMVGLAAQSGEALLANDVTKEPRFMHLELLDIASGLAVPIKLGDKTIGVLAVGSDRADVFCETDATALETMASQTATAIENARLYKEMERLAATDPLTGLWNRRHMAERLPSEIAHAHQFRHELSVLVMDIDQFKLFNDTYGHLAGDEVIRAVAQLVVTSCREIDIVGRYGGDEFVVILPEAGPRGAAMVAGRILAALQKEPFEALGGRKVPISMSIGAASYPLDTDEMDGLFPLADTAMYRAKLAGGGRFASLTADPEEVPEELVAPSDMLRGLLITVDAKDHYTFKHCQEVSERAIALARAVGLSEERVRVLEVAGSLHDVGKIGVPTDILRKPGALSPDEWRMMHQHPQLGRMLLHQVSQKEEMLQAVLHHHERCDGMGYPDGLKGEEIPVLARILAVADAFSAMIADRPYRKALALQEALDELRRNIGKQFDPELTRKFIKLVEDGEIQWRALSLP